MRKMPSVGSLVDSIESCVDKAQKLGAKVT
jgi:hypothetical protein